MSEPEPATNRRRNLRLAWLAAALVLVVVALMIVEVIATGPTREAVAAYTSLIDAANRADLADVRALCSRDYARSHSIRLADEGGVVGFPRGIHKNFRAWRVEQDVWLCPTNRVGPVFRFVHEDGAWKFDGPVGYLRPGNQFVPAEAAPP